MANHIVAKTGLTQLKKYETTLTAGFDEISLAFITVPISKNNMLVYRNGLLNTLDIDYTFNISTKIIEFTEIFDTNSIITIFWNVPLGDIPNYPTNFWELSDTPTNYTGQANKYLAIKNDETGIEFKNFPNYPTNFWELSDTPENYTGQANKYLTVKNDETGVEFKNFPTSLSPSIITQDTNNRFVTDTEKNTWNAKAPTDVATTSTAGLVELATDAETQAGTDTTRAVTVAGMKSAVPFKTTTAMSLYVNSGAAYGSWGAGSDSNAGTQVAPLATIAKAIAKIPQVLAHAVTINLAGEPNYYEWKPDGTNGIKFTTGNSGITVAVVSGSTLSVAISGSAVTITLATGGSTIATIIAAIKASATVGAVIYAIAVGATSTNITATLSAQALTGGNVRTYAELVSLTGYFGRITLTGGSGCTAGVIIAPATANTEGILTSNAHSAVANLTVSTASASTKRAVSAHSRSDASATDVRAIGPWTYGLFANNSTCFHLRCGIYGATNAVYSENGANITAHSPYGAGNTTGLGTSAGLIVKFGASALGATTAESATPSGTIL